MNHWPTKPLGEVAEVFNGKTPAKVEQRVAGHPVLKIKDVDESGNFRGHFESFVDFAFAEAYAKKKVNTADVLILNAAHNADYVASKIFFADQQASGSVATGEWTIIRANPLFLLPGFVHHWVRSQVGRASIKNLVRGIHLYPSDVASVRFAIPPLAEQLRIVKLLDEADELRRLRAQADRCTAGLIPALFDEKFGDPTHLAKMCWSTKPLGEFAKVSYGLADKLDATTKPENGTRILTISNVLLHGSIDTKVEKYSVVEPAERAKARLQNFDLLFNWRNGSKEHVGKTAIWEGQVEGEVLHVSFLLKIRADLDQANPYFLWALINRLRATGYFTRNARMQINRKFNASELSALKLPLPPLVQQREFAARVSEIRAMQAEQTASHRRLDDLVQSMLHRAFKGEL
jgi:type I restriction enzyme S subunit